LEHISTSLLIDYVDLLISKLKIGGLLLIEVPNDNWVKYPHKMSSRPPHISFFSKKSLLTLFNTRSHIHLCKTVGSSVYKKKEFS